MRSTQRSDISVERPTALQSTGAAFLCDSREGGDALSSVHSPAPATGKLIHNLLCEMPVEDTQMRTDYCGDPAHSRDGREREGDGDLDGEEANQILGC